MPEDSKKNHDKKKNDPKEQRKPRQSRRQQDAAEKKKEKVEESKSASKVTVPPQKPVYESPPPEFYKNLKRETDEILKITEAENSKYNKKEIKSNWAKYEMPIETYDEMDAQEDMGADYEKLIQAPPSIGGHFQFKHEKSWDTNMGPSLYDKYFEIDMQNLATAISSIPFHERNTFDSDIFTETDIMTMNNRAMKYKQKYYNDKAYATPETVVEEKILNNLKTNLTESEVNLSDDEIEEEKDSQENDKGTSLIENKISNLETVENELTNSLQPDIGSSPVRSNKISKEDAILKSKPQEKNNRIDDHDDIFFGIVGNKEAQKNMSSSKIHPSISSPDENIIENKLSANITTQVSNTLVEDKKNPVIESPEDLEKWLDDFLDS